MNEINVCYKCLANVSKSFLVCKELCEEKHTNTPSTINVAFNTFSDHTCLIDD